MIQMREFQLSLEGTLEEQTKIREANAIQPFSAVIEMPIGAQIRRVNTRLIPRAVTGIHPQTKEIGTFEVREELVYLWAECESDAKIQPRKFLIIPTGFDVPRALNYVGSFLLQAGVIVLHVYGPDICCKWCADTGKMFDNTSHSHAGAKTECSHCEMGKDKQE